MRGELLEELIHLIMVAKKSYERLSASWRPWDASSMAQYWPESFRIRTDDIILSPRIENPGEPLMSPGVQRPESLEFQCPRTGDRSDKGDHPFSAIFVLCVCAS